MEQHIKWTKNNIPKTNHKECIEFLSEVEVGKARKLGR